MSQKLDKNPKAQVLELDILSCYATPFLSQQINTVNICISNKFCPCSGEPFLFTLDVKSSGAQMLKEVTDETERCIAMLKGAAYTRDGLLYMYYICSCSSLQHKTPLCGSDVTV